MSDHTFYDEAFFAEFEQPKPLRKQVVDCIHRYCALSGSTHSVAWRKGYLELEGATGFRVPDKKGLDAVEKEGLLQQLLEVVKKLAGQCGDHASEINDAIPEYVPCESDRSRWTTKGTASCSHEWGVFSTVLEDVCLLVQCVECGAYGKVSDSTAEEWQRAFHAPSKPYHWPHGDRVELLPGKEEDEAKRYIRRSSQIA